MKGVAKLLGGDPTQVDNDMNAVLEFETKIANVSTTILNVACYVVREMDTIRECWKHLKDVWHSHLEKI